jgi:hypothetical protein
VAHRVSIGRVPLHGALFSRPAANTALITGIARRTTRGVRGVSRRSCDPGGDVPWWGSAADGRASHIGRVRPLDVDCVALPPTCFGRRSTYFHRSALASRGLPADRWPPDRRTRSDSGHAVHRRTPNRCSPPRRRGYPSFRINRLRVMHLHRRRRGALRRGGLSDPRDQEEGSSEDGSGSAHRVSGFGNRPH